MRLVKHTVGRSSVVCFSLEWVGGWLCRGHSLKGRLCACGSACVWCGCACMVYCVCACARARVCVCACLCAFVCLFVFVTSKYILYMQVLCVIMQP